MASTSLTLNAHWQEFMRQRFVPDGMPRPAKWSAPRCASSKTGASN
jgi:hypothetical protein